MKPVIDWVHNSIVAVSNERPTYPKIAPFHPSESYPEWPNQEIGREDNPAYRAVRACFYELGFDRVRFGTVEWNPLSELVGPNKTVVIKPNFVSHRNTGERLYGLTDTDSLVTHGSILRPIIDYVAKAQNGVGRIIVGDCPIQGTRWDQVVSLTGLDKIAQYAKERYPGLRFEVKDFRLGTARMFGDYMVSRVVDESRLAEYREVDLGTKSSLCELMKEDYSFGVAQYPKHRMRAAHTPTVNKYLFPNEFLDADLFINVPKMKSHMKAGITCALKNLVGINGHKDYLPHFRFGSPKDKGDEYPDGNWLWDLYWAFVHRDWDCDAGFRKHCHHIAAWMCARGLMCFYRKPPRLFTIGGGSWHGNDTLWRTVIDINRAFLYWNPNRNCYSDEIGSGRNYLAVLDGLVGGHRESPLAPTPIKSGVVMAALNPVALDTAACSWMGFDYRKIKQLSEAYSITEYPLAQFKPADIGVYGLDQVNNIEQLRNNPKRPQFEPSQGWKDHIEL